MIPGKPPEKYQTTNPSQSDYTYKTLRTTRQFFFKSHTSHYQENNSAVNWIEI